MLIDITSYRYKLMSLAMFTRFSVCVISTECNKHWKALIMRMISRVYWLRFGWNDVCCINMSYNADTDVRDASSHSPGLSSCAVWVLTAVIAYRFKRPRTPRWDCESWLDVDAFFQMGKAELSQHVVHRDRFARFVHGLAYCGTAVVEPYFPLLILGRTYIFGSSKQCGKLAVECKRNAKRLTVPRHRSASPLSRENAVFRS